MATSAAHRQAPATSSLAGSGRLQRCAPRKLAPCPFGRFSDPIRSDPLGLNLLGRLQFREEWQWQLAGLLRLFGCVGRTVAGLLRQVYMYFYK